MAVLGIVDQSASPAIDKLVNHLADRAVLLVLDNCEHLLEPCARLAGTVLAGTAGVRILATSRATLGVDGEHLVAVPPLSLPEPGAVVTASDLGRYDAMTLLLERARASQPTFAITEQNQADAVALCTRLDGIPLAIELAATRLRSLTLGQLVDRLGQRFALLTGGSRVAEARQQTLRALVDWSYSLCCGEERTLWARLSVFAGDFDLEAAEGVCASTDLPSATILDLLDRLVSQSIVLAEPSADRVRFRLLETIREYGRDRLAAAGDSERMRRRHRDFYLYRTQQIATGWCTPGQRDGLSTLTSRPPEPPGGAGPCARRPVGRLATAGVRDGTAPSLVVRRLPRRGQEADRPRAPFRRPGDGPGRPARQCAVVVGLAVPVAGRQRRRPPATRRVPGHRGRSGHAGLRDDAARLRRPVRRTARPGRHPVSRRDEHVRGSRKRRGRAVDDVPVRDQPCPPRRVGDATQVCHASLDLSARSGEQLCRSYALWVLGFVTWRDGNNSEALRHARDGLAIQRGFNDPVGAALMIELLAWVHVGVGERARAATLLATADSLWRQIGTTIGAFGPLLLEHHARCRQAIGGASTDRPWRGVADAVAVALAEPSRPDGKPDGPPAGEAPLTDRERQVADKVAQGLTNRAIASALVISPRTVDGHVERILAKLGFTARAQIAAWTATRDTHAREENR